MRVAIDVNGYSYNVDTGDYLTIYYDEDGNAFDGASGEFIESVSFDQSGQTVYHGDSGWNQTLQQIAAGVLVPRGGSNQLPRTPGSTSIFGGGSSSGSIGANISLPKWAVYAMGAVALGYAFGFIKQGRR